MPTELRITTGLARAVRSDWTESVTVTLAILRRSSSLRTAGAAGGTTGAPSLSKYSNTGAASSVIGTGSGTTGGVIFWAISRVVSAPVQNPGLVEYGGAGTPAKVQFGPEPALAFHRFSTSVR